MDFRKEWFKDRILTYLEENDPNLFEDFLRKDDNYIMRQFDVFLDDKSNDVENLWNQVFVVYKTFYNKTIEEEIEVEEEEVTKPQSSSFLAQDDKKRDKKGKKKKKKSKAVKIEHKDEMVTDLPDDDDRYDRDRIDDEGEEDDERQKIRKKKKFPKEGRISPSTIMENLRPNEQTGKSSIALSYVTVKKKIEKVIQVGQIQGHFGVVDDNKMHPDGHYVYFIKKFNCDVPRCRDMQQANIKMPSYFVVYNLVGNVLDNLEKILTRVFIPLYRNRISEHADLEEVVDAEDDESSEINIEFEDVLLRRRPSYYFIRKHIDSFDSMKDELNDVNENRQFLDRARQFISPETERFNVEMVNKLKKLVNIVKWARNELEAEEKLSIPDTLCNFDSKANTNEEIIKNIKNTVELWISRLESEIKAVSDNMYIDDNLLEEYEYWHRVEIRSSSIVDEMDSQIVNEIAEKLKEGHVSLFVNFQTRKKKLNIMHEDAKENAEVLRTLRYYFKVLMYDDFETITREVPTLIKSLKSIWMLSKYYSEERNMERMLNNIKGTLCNRVKKTFDVKTLFECSPHEVNDKLRNAVRMLNTWKTSYLEIRAEIESNSDYFVPRWEFDKQKLFSETDYISSVLQNIKNIFEIIQHYRDLFASKFTKLTEHTTEYKNLQQKIADLTKPIEKVDFDVYLEIFEDEWREISELFQQGVIDVDQHLKILIIKIFSQIRSITIAIEVVEDLRKIKTRPTIHDSVPYICNKILASFAKKMRTTDDIFEEKKLINVEIKIYDSISWANNLVKRTKEKVDNLQNINSLFTTEQYQKIIEQFNNMTMKVQSYNEKMYKEWSSKVTSFITETLKQNVIAIEEAEKFLDLKQLIEKKRGSKIELTDSERMSIESNKNKTELGFGALAITLKWIAKSKICAENYLHAQQVKTLKKIEQAHKVSWLEFIGDSLLIEKGFKFKLKLKNEIFDIVTEAENLQKCNFKLPDKLQEFLMVKNQLFKNIENINNIVIKYNDTVMGLQPAKILLMKQYLLETEVLIQPGLTLYTWKCSVLDDYAKNATIKLQQLSCLLYQVDEIFKKLYNFVGDIENMNFLLVNQATSEDIECEDFFRTIDKQQIKEIDRCLNTYEKISQTLIQLESLVLYTHTGRSKLMIYYYDVFSEKILEALVRSVLNSISGFGLLFTGECSKHFINRAYLNNKEIKLYPTCEELHKLVRIVLTRVFLRLKNLKHWEPKSCKIGIRSSTMFYTKLIENKNVKESCVILLHNLQNLCDSITTSMVKWLKYSILWKYDKDITIKQFTCENPELADYESRFDFYSNICNKIEQEETTVHVYCVSILVQDLINQLRNHCFEWKHKLSVQLAVDTKQIILYVSNTIEKLNSSLNQEIIDIKILAEVLRSINEIQRVTIDMEIKFYKIQEHFHELEMQNFNVRETNIKDFKRLKSEWGELYDKSLYKKFALQTAKHSVIEQVEQRIHDFLQKCEKFSCEYEIEFANIEMFNFDICEKLITTFSDRCAELEKEKNELEIIRECFEIASFDFTVFIETKRQLRGLQMKYKLLDGMTDEYTRL